MTKLTYSYDVKEQKLEISMPTNGQKTYLITGKKNCTLFYELLSELQDMKKKLIKLADEYRGDL